jgi:hypothetical protein
MIIDLLSIKNALSWQIVLGLVIIAFGLGFMVKSAVIFRQRKRILRLEDEMLANHSRILTLEKKVSEGRKESNGVHKDYDFASPEILKKGRAV